MQGYEEKMPGKMRMALVVIALLVVLAVFFANSFVQGPMIQGDEGSYLANAAAMAGFPNDMAGSYHAGYSMFIAPAFWIADTTQGIWTAVQAINAALYALTILGLWLIAKHLSPTTTSLNRFAAVVLVSLYPMWVVMVGYSFAQNAFVPVFLFTFLMYLRSIRGGIGSWMVLGLISGFLYWIHPTAVAPLTAVGISAAYITWHRRNYMAFGSLLLTMGAMILIYRLGVTPWLYEYMNISGLGPHKHYLTLSRLLVPLTTIAGIQKVIARIAGQFFYLTVGTVGLSWLGLFTLTGKAVRSSLSEDRDVVLRDRAIAILLWLSLVAIVVLTALNSSANPATQRLDHWMYGRHVEGIIAPILLVGALTVSFRKILWTIPIAILCAAILSTGLDYYTHFAPFNISAFWQLFWLHAQGLWVWLAAGCALIVLAAAVPRRIGMMLIAVIFLFSGFMQTKWHVAESKIASGRWGAALTIRDRFAPGTCVGFDYSGIDSYDKHIFWFDFGFILFDYKLQRISFKQWLNTCDGPLFSYKKNLDERGDERGVEVYQVYPVLASQAIGPMAWMKGRPPKDSIYPIVVSNKSPSIAVLNALGPGWLDLEIAYVWSSGADALLKLPVPEECRSGACSVILSLSVYGASGVRPVEVVFETDSEDAPLPPPLVFRSDVRQRIAVPLDGSQTVLSLTINTPDAISPSVLLGGPDARVLGVALHSIDLKIPNELTPEEKNSMSNKTKGE